MKADFGRIQLNVSVRTAKYVGRQTELKQESNRKDLAAEKIKESIIPRKVKETE